MKIEYVIEQYNYDSCDGIAGRFDNVEDAIAKHIELNNKQKNLEIMAQNLGSSDYDSGTNYRLIVEYEANDERQTKPYR